MSKMKLGYGSEYHLMRVLARHRTELNNRIISSLNYDKLEIQWLDFPNNPRSKLTFDDEFVGMEFLRNDIIYPPLLKEWQEVWPTTGNAQNWDAIAKINDEWLLIEAKARANEIKSSTSAKLSGGLNKIKEELDNVKNSRSIRTVNDWTKEYYQLANRILALDFLHSRGIKAKLVLIYFINGFFKNGKQEGVKSIHEWEKLIQEQDKYLGINGHLWCEMHIKHVFYEVS